VRGAVSLHPLFPGLLGALQAAVGGLPGVEGYALDCLVPQGLPDPGHLGEGGGEQRSKPPHVAGALAV
jgi:hypothetical protein